MQDSCRAPACCQALPLQVGALSPAAKGTNSSRMGGGDVTGGDPAQLADNIYLCSRSDSDPDRQAASYQQL